MVLAWLRMFWFAMLMLVVVPGALAFYSAGLPSAAGHRRDLSIIRKR